MILSGCFFIVVFLWSRYFPLTLSSFSSFVITNKRNSVIALIFQFFNLSIFKFFNFSSFPL